MLHSMTDFSGNKGDITKLKKVVKLVQHYSRQDRYYVPKQNITIYESIITIDESLRKIRKKRKGKKKNCVVW